MLPLLLATLTGACGGAAPASDARGTTAPSARSTEPTAAPAASTTTTTNADPALLTRTRRDVQSIGAAALLYLADDPTADCPSFADLTSAGTLDAHYTADDAWGVPFQIACEDEDVVVRSAGPDRTIGTGDDVRSDL